MFLTKNNSPNRLARIFKGFWPIKIKNQKKLPKARYLSILSKLHGLEFLNLPPDPDHQEQDIEKAIIIPLQSFLPGLGIMREAPEWPDSEMAGKGYEGIARPPPKLLLLKKQVG